MYDLLVFIGRFSPLHAGHQLVIDNARKLAKNVLVLVGSAGVARSTRNPFTYDERAKLIKSIYPDVITRPVHDHTYNDSAWVMEVQEQVRNVVYTAEGLFQGSVENAKTIEAEFQRLKIGLIGCEKDHTSYYLKMFPDWDSEAVNFISPLNATAFRKEMFEDSLGEPWENTNLHAKTFEFLSEFRHTPEFAKLKMEYDYLIEYRKKYGEGPFLTADALVQVGGKILLITRGKEYGHGLLAMPGGFVNKYEKFADAAVRELREETRLRVPVPVLRGSIVRHSMFDDPHRSERGRLVTECYHYKLQNDTKLPEVRGDDDAGSANWYDLGSLRGEDFFEDHYHIIRNMLGIN